MTDPTESPTWTELAGRARTAVLCRTKQCGRGIWHVVTCSAAILFSTIAEKNPLRQDATPAPFVLSASRVVIIALLAAWIEAGRNNPLLFSSPAYISLGVILSVALPVCTAMQRASTTEILEYGKIALSRVGLGENGPRVLSTGGSGAIGTMIGLGTAAGSHFTPRESSADPAGPGRPFPTPASPAATASPAAPVAPGATTATPPRPTPAPASPAASAPADAPPRPLQPLVLPPLFSDVRADAVETSHAFNLRIPKPWSQVAQADIEADVRELPGREAHPRILAMFENVSFVPTQGDEDAWCSAAVNTWLVESGFQGTGLANARSFLNWGREIERPVEDCVVVLWRESRSSSKGHVGLFRGFSADGNAVLIRGGNQSNAARDSWYPTERVLGYRLPA